MNPTGGLKKAVAEIVAPGDTETQKAKKIYATVMNLENTNFTREKTKAERKKEKIKDIKSIEDVWKQKRGSSDEIALLFVALCRAAGLRVDPMVVADRSRAIFDQDLLYSGQLDEFSTDAIATLSLRSVSMQFAALVLIAGSQAYGSWFSKGQPVPQWGLDAAKLHTPAYAKDSSSVTLFDEYVETVDAQGRALEREREAIRILKPQGRDTGCEVSYDETQKINYFRAWTIAADEKQYQGQDADFIERCDTDIPIMLSSRKTRIAHPPAADVGAVVVCESEELMEPYLQEKVWQFQSGTPVVSEALEVDLPPGRAQTNSWHNHEPVNPVEVAPGHWRWELKDIPALTLRDVPSAPDWGALAARMSVQWGDAAIEGADNQWRAIGQWVTTLEANRPDPSPEITAKVQSLIGGAPTFYTKLNRITEYIQKEIRYFVVTRGIGGLQANHAGDIYRNSYGDCKDKATLLISMLQVAGIHAYYVPVDHRRGFVDPANPSLAGDHMIAAIEIPPDIQAPHFKAIVNGKDSKRYLIFDPTDERTPVGNLSSVLQGGYGTLAAGPASQVIALPVLPPDTNGTERKGNFRLAADGTLTGFVESTHFGPGGADIRTILKYSGEKERREAIEKAVVHDVPGAVIDSFNYVQPPELDKPVEIRYQFTAAQYALQAGPVVLLRPRVVGSHVLPLDDKPRTVSIDLGATGRWHDSYDITMPASLTVDETPDPVDLDLSEATHDGDASRWAPDSRSILYGHNENDVGDIWSAPLNGGRPKKLTNFNHDRILSFDVSPDNRFVVSLGKYDADIVLLEHVR